MLSLIFAQSVECAAGTPGGADCSATLSSLTGVFGRILSALIPLGGIALFIMLIVGGFMFMSSSGDPRKTEGAKSTITYAIAGIIILASAFLIVSVIATLTGVNSILNFNVYFNP